MKKFLVYIFCGMLLFSCTTARIHRMGKQYVTIYHIFPSPDKIGIGICYVIFYCIIYVFLWKWIIYATYVGLRNAFFTFTGIFGEYFGASYSDYCPGIEWDEKEED